MNAHEHRYLEEALSERCGRVANVNRVDRTSIRIVLEPVDDRGRVDVIASFDDDGWSVNDGGLNAVLLDSEFDFIVMKLEEIGSPIRRDGNTISAVVSEVSFIESVAQFVSNLEFIPVLAGLWSNHRPTAA